jgi:uncharacterized protein YwgA
MDKMPEKIKKLVAYFKFLNLKLDLHKFHDRLELQKIAFLLKSMGISLNYEFGLYFSWVYSQKLYADSMNFAREFHELKSDYQINEDERAVLEKLKEVLENNEALDVAMLIIYKNLTYENTDKVVAKIKKIRPHVSEEEILDGINVAKKLLFKPEYFTEEIKQELKLWDSIT